MKMAEGIKSFRDIINNKNVLQYRSNVEIQNLTKVYIENSEIDLFDLITNINILTNRNADEQMLLISTYLKHPDFNIKRIILDYDLLTKCDIHNQLNIIYSFVYALDGISKKYSYAKEEV